MMTFWQKTRNVLLMENRKRYILVFRYRNVHHSFKLLINIVHVVARSNATKQSQPVKKEDSCSLWYGRIASRNNYPQHHEFGAVVYRFLYEVCCSLQPLSFPAAPANT
jgi:hypothetical protein